MKMTEVRKSSDKELQKQIDSTRESLASLKRERYIKDEKNVNRARGLKRDLARMLSEQTNRQHADTDKKEEK